MGFDLFEPVLHSIERGTIIDRIRHYDTHRSFVVRLRDSLEPLLPCCVPYLHSYLLPVDFDGLDLEVNP